MKLLTKKTARNHPKDNSLTRHAKPCVHVSFGSISSDDIDERKIRSFLVWYKDFLMIGKIVYGIGIIQGRLDRFGSNEGIESM